MVDNSDDLDFIIKAAHYAGVLETDGTIRVEEWEPLIGVLVAYLIDYLYTGKYAGKDFFEELEKELIKNFASVRVDFIE